MTKRCAICARPDAPNAEVDLVERYYKEQGLFRTDATPDAEYTAVLELDLGSVEPSLAGPKRPQDRVRLSDMKHSFQAALRAPIGAARLRAERRTTSAHVTGHADAMAQRTPITHGAVVIAAITSCTNTSNPSVMLGAGLLAKKAVARGLTRPALRQDEPGTRIAGRDRISAKRQA